DRHTILARIARGEKQSALAKEFHVSRAAICNLNKHREQVLARTPNPLAKHPKKPRAYKSSLFINDNSDSSGGAANCSMASGKTKPDVVARVGSSMPPTVAHVTEVQSRPIAILLTLVRSRTVTPKQLRRYADQLLHLVVERALEVALVPESAHTQRASFSDDDMASSSAIADSTESAHPDSRSFGVALRASDMAMANAFQSLEPSQPVGYLLRAHAAGAGAGLTLASQLRGRDRDLSGRNVFLFGLTVHASAVRHVTEAVRVLIQHHGACEERVWVVALTVASSVADCLHARFPRVRIIAARIQASPSAPASAVLFERIETPDAADTHAALGDVQQQPSVESDAVWSPLQSTNDDDAHRVPEDAWTEYAEV
ncbi:hypothetical protein PybrP1_004242, partial [[Pythium] brassicae (nom. inval.)]